MNHDFDYIRDYQIKLGKRSCPACQAQRLKLVLHYDPRNDSLRFSAFCQSCEVKYAIDTETGCLFHAPYVPPARTSSSWCGALTRNVKLGAV